MKEFHTADRRLEQFLYAHLIPFERQIKDVRGYTIWTYVESPRLMMVIAEYDALLKEHGMARDN